MGHKQITTEHMKNYTTTLVIRQIQYCQLCQIQHLMTILTICQVQHLTAMNG